MRFLEAIRSTDWILTACAVLLVGFGLAMLLSSTYASGSISSLFIRQLISFTLALVVFLFVSALPYMVWERWAFRLYALGLAGLGIVFAFGNIIRGTVSRLEIAGVQIQPSEFMKVGLILTLAVLLARARDIGVKQTLAILLLTAVPLGLILLEPDLGVAALLGAVVFGLLVTWGLRWRFVVVLLLLAAIGGWTSWHWLLADYQKERLQVFLNPTSDPLGAGYNVVQSIIALGSGQLAGRGLGHGPQSQLKFLPERHTDFILASVGEELGFIGVALILILYAVLLIRIFVLAHTTSDRFGRAFALATLLLLLFSLMVSAGMNMGLLPVTGIPLPLVSYGGSNLLTTFVLLGIVQSVRVYSKWKRRDPLEISHIT